MKHNVKKNTN